MLSCEVSTVYEKDNVSKHSFSVDDVCLVFQRVMSLSTTDAETLWPTVPK